jgi:hypothetical protein
MKQQLNIKFISTRQVYFLVIAILCCITGFAQGRKDITGAWTGWVKTTDKKITYEVVISDSSGTLIGFSKIIFTNKNKTFYAIKSLQIGMESDSYLLEEMELLDNNFEEDAPKKIKQINTLDLEMTNKLMMLKGVFKTKATMGLRSATGEVYLQKAALPDSSELFVALEKMGKTEDLSFVKKAKEKAIAEAKAQKLRDSIAVVDSINLVKKKLLESQQPPIVVVEKKVEKPVAVPVAKPAPVVAATKPTPTPAPKTAPVAAKPTSAPVVVASTPKPQPKPAPVIAAGSASDLNKRSIETIQTVYFNTDSLKLTLYDNGEVDGDTVSVVVNGKVIMGKKGLSTNAITETLYLTPELGDSLQMIMYAENLGAIAPNTGLLIVQDGKDRYEIRFSGDLTKNAAIIFKRRKSKEG